MASPSEELQLFMPCNNTPVDKVAPSAAIPSSEAYFYPQHVKKEHLGSPSNAHIGDENSEVLRQLNGKISRNQEQSKKSVEAHYQKHVDKLACYRRPVYAKIQAEIQQKRAATRQKTEECIKQSNKGLSTTEEECIPRDHSEVALEVAERRVVELESENQRLRQTISELHQFWCNAATHEPQRRSYHFL